MQTRLPGGAFRCAIASFLALFILSQTAGAEDLKLGETLAEGRTSANEGHLTIQWQQGTPPYRLTQVSGTSTGESITLYEGSDQSYFMTGLLEGENRFIVEDSAGTSVELVVDVDYPHRALVFGTLGLGAFLLLALVIIVYTGNRRYV